MEIESAHSGHLCPSFFNDFISAARIAVVNSVNGLFIIVLGIGIVRYLFQWLSTVTAIQHFLEIAALKEIVLDIARFGAVCLLGAMVAILGHDCLLS